MSSSSKKRKKKEPSRLVKRLAADNRGEFLRIGDVARGVGLTNQMVHLYCSMGLLQEVKRTKSGYRLFGPEAARRVKIIRDLIRRGYTLREMKQTFRRGFNQ